VKSMLSAILACAVVVGCAEPGWGWKRTDGQSTKGNPALLAQFETDKRGCIAQMQRDNLAEANNEGVGLVGALRTSHGKEEIDVIRQCMAQRNYAVVPVAETE